jgi:hypothetical protein
MQNLNSEDAKNNFSDFDSNYIPLTQPSNLTIQESKKKKFYNSNSNDTVIDQDLFVSQSQQIQNITIPYQPSSALTATARLPYMS